MTYSDLMLGLSVVHLRFEVTPIESMVFGEQPGSALRGGLYQALSQHYCSKVKQPSVAPNHTEQCPACWLLAAEDPQSERGQNPPRPLTIEPPEPGIYHRGDTFSFGVTLIGDAQKTFPYVVRAVQYLGQFGVGKGRGRFRVSDVKQADPLRHQEESLFEGRMVNNPTWRVDSETLTQALIEPVERASLSFITPLRLTARKRLVKTIEPTVFVQRLLERCERLATSYSNGGSVPSREDWRQASQDAVNISKGIVVIQDNTVWEEARSGSHRLHRYTPISGLTGTTTWEGNLTPLMPWLLWGQSLHVGKNAVKGNGWFLIHF